METLKVVIPTDFSVQAEYAFIMVQKLRQKTPLEIHFLHVLQMPDTVSMDAEGKIFTCGEIDVKYIETQRDIALRKLNNLQNMYGHDIHIHLRMGKLVECILHFADTGGMDIVAMGTKGAFGLKEKLSGSQTQMIVRKSKVPVLSLMCDRSDLELKNILLVHDFSQYEDMKFEVLKILTNNLGARLHLLHIIKNNHQESQEQQQITDNMDTFIQQHNLGSYEAHLLIDSDIEQGVIHFNQMHEMDIICIGTHGKGSVFHSSATEKLINHLYKPIISFHID